MANKTKTGNVIKMRNNNNPDAICSNCGAKANDSLNMFDIAIAGQILTVCDMCNETLFMKTLKADCYKNQRTKSQHDMAIIKRRTKRDWIGGV